MFLAISFLTEGFKYFHPFPYISAAISYASFDKLYNFESEPLKPFHGKYISFLPFTVSHPFSKARSAPSACPLLKMKPFVARILPQ